MDGLRATALRRAAKTIPIPIPAPPRPMAAEPIPRFWETWTRALAISEEYGRAAWRPKALRAVALRMVEACWRFMAWNGAAVLVRAPWETPVTRRDNGQSIEPTAMAIDGRRV
jgi:hypothetical protein